MPRRAAEWESPTGRGWARRLSEPPTSYVRSQALGRSRKHSELIDVTNDALFELNSCANDEIAPTVSPILIAGEEVVSCYEAVRDFVVFTNKRHIATNVQGLTGKKRDFTSLPYRKIQAFSLDTAGTFDLDAERDLWSSGLGKVRLEFKGNADIRQIGQMIGSFTLQRRVLVAVSVWASGATT
jgi:hypothetical protein